MKLIIEAKPGSDLQREVMVRMFEWIGTTLKCLFESKHKKTKVDWRIKS